MNNENIYNQNFSGLYCTCQKPYPDPEATFEDDMIQCLICEDWLHASHLDAVVPANDHYSEMICKACMNKNDFLHDYSNLAVNVEIVDVVTVNGNVAKAITNTEDKTLILNEDVDMADEKDQNSAKNGSSVKDDDCAATQDKTKPSEEKEITPTEEFEDKTKTDDMHTDSENQEPDSTEAKETTHGANKDHSKEEVQKENEIASDTTADDKIEGTNENSATSNEQRETDERSASDVNANKNEAEVAANIKTSDNNLETSSTVEEKEKDDVNSIRADNRNNKSEASLSEQTKDGSDAKSESESGNIEVDNSQESLAKDNMDDKTDAVMDAIDALLESDTTVKDSESKETRNNLQANEITQETNDVEMCEKQTKQNEPESIQRSTTDSNKKTDADVEGTDGSSQKEPSGNVNKVDDEVQDDSENNESNIVDTTETTDSENKTTDESPKDTVKNSVVTDKFVNGDVNETLNETNNTSKVETDVNKNDEDVAFNTTESTNENKRKLCVTEEFSPKKVKLDSSECERPKGIKKVYKGATFWPSSFRQKLCTCGECISMYKSLNVLFLTDLEDTVSYYESLGKANIDGVASQYEKGLQALSSLDRIQQINALTEYNKMRDKLLDFLKSFKDRREVVKEEDIKAFFADMKPRREPDGVYFCR